MKTRFNIVLHFMLVVCACQQPAAPPAKRQTPKALEEKVSSVEIMSKRASDDLLDALYYELAEQTPELKALEDGIDKLNKARPDSMAAFTSFSTKNEAYFALTNKYLLQMQDSVLKKTLQQLLQQSLRQYEDTVKAHRDIITAIQAGETSLKDLHIAVKIIRTLPLIQQYQKDHLPPLAPLQNFNNQLDFVNHYADSLVQVKQK